MKAFLMGLGIGVGLGVLFAPNSGEVTRGKVRKHFTGLADKAEDVVQETVAAYAGGSSPETERKETEKKAQAREEGLFPSSDPINTLTRDELLNVTGIGSVLADKIISSRPYSSRQELVQRGILPQHTFEELERELSRRERRSA
jgi:DNA uptake protein ComE-like DNA-binding protein